MAKDKRSTEPPVQKAMGAVPRAALCPVSWVPPGKRLKLNAARRDSPAPGVFLETGRDVAEGGVLAKIEGGAMHEQWSEQRHDAGGGDDDAQAPGRIDDMAAELVAGIGHPGVRVPVGAYVLTLKADRRGEQVVHSVGVAEAPMDRSGYMLNDGARRHRMSWNKTYVQAVGPTVITAPVDVGNDEAAVTCGSLLRCLQQVAHLVRTLERVAVTPEEEPERQLLLGTFRESQAVMQRMLKR